MAWSAATLDTIEAAIVDAAANGFSNVSIDGLSVQTYSLKDLLALRDSVKEAIKAEDTTVRKSFGIRFVKLIPPGCG